MLTEKLGKIRELEYSQGMQYQVRDSESLKKHALKNMFVCLFLQRNTQHLLSCCQIVINHFMEKRLNKDCLDPKSSDS